MQRHKNESQEKKSIATPPPRNDPIPNQDKNLGLQKYQSLPPYVPPFTPGFKSLRNETNDDNPETTYTSRTDKDDTSRTNCYDSIENVKAMNNTNDNDKYKEENLQNQDSNETVIK